ncbi:hypothetical protein A2U01_0109707, partial [Trifolium medium]|nr:hypothetical protein [Trifolium medium]
MKISANFVAVSGARRTPAGAACSQFLPVLFCCLRNARAG